MSREHMQTELGCGDPLTADALSIEAAARRIEAEAGKKKRSGRTEFQRGRLTVDADGQVAVSKTGVQGSVILSLAAQENGPTCAHQSEPAICAVAC
jgi:molybdopterin biosynthesis enzyme